MSAGYVLGIDQSTQGTKVLLFDAEGKIVKKAAKNHHQYIDERGWVEHDLEEIWQNLCSLVKTVVADIDVHDLKAVGISNQRETAAAWNKETGEPICHAVVWQCARGAKICEALERQGYAVDVKEVTGLPLSPYFSAAKWAWILQNVDGAQDLMKAGKLCLGTIDSYLVYRMTGGKVYQTDYSNASRTQLFDIDKLAWSPEICQIFGIDVSALPKVTDSDGDYGTTDFDGIIPLSIPIHGVLGDSHAALFGQGCQQPGMAKATYGTGSSVMMNIGDKPIRSTHGLVTSLAWSISGKPEYVLEGNINYTGAAITWLKDDLELIADPAETENLAKAANPLDKSYFVPAFTGLGAPYWNSKATGLFTGLTRLTGKKEMVRAVLDAIAYQINDVAQLMQQESGHKLPALRVDGGPTKNGFLMQRQADVLNCPVEVPKASELSAMGAAYCAGIAIGLYDQSKLFANIERQEFAPKMAADEREEKLAGWKQAIAQVLSTAK